MNTNQFILYSSSLDATEYEGWCTYTVEVPAGGCVGIDLLSLMADDVIKGWKRESVERIKNELRPRTMRMPGGCSLRFMTGVRELVHVKKDRSAMILGGDVNC